MMRGVSGWVAVAAALAAAPAMGWAQTPNGAEFQVNSYTTNEQAGPAVASDASGNFVVVWHSYPQDGSGTGIFGRRFGASGAPLGTEFQINSYTYQVQTSPAIASDAGGNFVVVWYSYLKDGNRSGIGGQRFNAAGLPQGAEFQVNTYTTDFQSAPSIASGAGGSFVVVWHSLGQDGSAGGVFGRRFDASGVPQGGEFQVNTYTTGDQHYPDVATDAAGNFVVVWHSRSQDGAGYGIFGRRYDAAGAPLGGEFQVNTYTTSYQGVPEVTSDPNGNFVVAWNSYTQDGAGYGIFVRRFDATATPLGSEFKVNTYTTGQQKRPVVASGKDGSFVVVWDSNGQDGSSYGVFAQRYDASGVPQGGEFRINSYTTNAQVPPTVASNPDGDFVVAWTSHSQDGSPPGVFGQRYGDLIFQDGFESGDFSRWSSASADGGDLSVGGAGALAGTGAGLQALVDDAVPLFVQDDSSSAENRYRARFYFDPNGFDPGEAGGFLRVRIFIAFNAANQRLITLVLRRVGGAYSLLGRVRRDDGSRADTGFFGITNAPHFVELDWQRSSAPGANNGQFVLRIDDVPVSTLTGIDNDASPLEFARMGVMSIKTPSASGTLYFDQLESRRERYIGPE